MSKKFHVAIVGASGAVGIELLRLLEERKFPVGQLTLLASARSAGRVLSFLGEPVTIQELTHESFAGVDIALFSAGGGISKEFVPSAVKAGAVVVDNSSAFRSDPSVPLVIPEINGADIADHQGVIANPNCSTAITLMALYPLHQRFGVKRVFASTYQAVSGSGAQGIVELETQMAALNRGEKAEKKIYDYQIAFNAIPRVDSFQDSGYTKEEMKMQVEGAKIMHLPAFKASVTCVRIPVYRAHSIAVSAEFEQPVDLANARKAIESFPGIDLVDNPAAFEYPTPLHVSGEDNCKVGRLRVDCALDNGLSFWVVGDQLLKGAALNAVQIAERLAV